MQKDERNPYRRIREALDSEEFANLPQKTRAAIERDVDELAGELRENAGVAAKVEALAAKAAEGAMPEAFHSLSNGVNLAWESPISLSHLMFDDGVHTFHAPVSSPRASAGRRGPGTRR